MPMNHTVLTLIILVLTSGLSNVAFATSPSSANNNLSIELNKISQDESACALIFVTKNNTSQKLDNVALEFVLFDNLGLVKYMNVFDFGSLPPSKTLVKRFRMKETKCNDLSHILINGGPICNVKPMNTNQCDILDISNKTTVKFGL